MLSKSNPTRTNLSGKFKSVTSPGIIFLLVSGAVISLHAIFGFPQGHSSTLNLYWQGYFTEQLFGGEFYPRWLYNYAGGIGAPVFYFYPPLPFYLFSFLKALTFNLGGAVMIMSLGYMSILFLSGAAFYAYISRTTEKFWAIFFSILYMFLPYHYIDLEIRSSVGEALAYAWVPLLFMGISSANRSWKQIVLVGFGYAGLILSHPPSALLVAPVLLVFSIASAEKSRWIESIGYVLGIGGYGIFVSGVYLVPAIMLLDVQPYDALVTASGAHFQTTSWLIGNPGIYHFGIKVYLVLAATSLLSMGATAAFGWIRIRYPSELIVDQHTRSLITACIIAMIGAWFFMTKLSQPIWEQFSILDPVQFPWRLGIVIDFCSALLLSLTVPKLMGFANSRYRIRKWPHLASEQGIAITFLVLFAITVIIVCRHPNRFRTGDVLEELFLIAHRPIWMVESELYLPAENVNDLLDINRAEQIHEAGMSRWMSFVESLPPISALREIDISESIRIDEAQTGEYSVFVLLNSPATIRIRKIYFPHWRLLSSSGEEISVYADLQTGLIALDLEAGQYELTLDRRLLVPEIIGLVISLVATATGAFTLACSRILHFPTHKPKYVSGCPW